MTGPEHFVEHVEDKADLLDVAGLGPVKVVLIMRCFVFRETRGAAQANPKAVHDICQKILCTWLMDNPLQLPVPQAIR